VVGEEGEQQPAAAGALVRRSLFGWTRALLLGIQGAFLGLFCAVDEGGGEQPAADDRGYLMI